MRSIGMNRLQSILDLVRERGFVRTTELAETLGVSSVTIRQDVETLQGRGLVHKTHGGVAALPGGTPDSAFALRAVEQRDQKQRIGAAAAALIQQGETILLDAGTTTIEVARSLGENQGLTVVTCALNAALEAGGKRGVEVVLCGGLLNPHTLAVTGYQVEHVLAEVHADRLFLATYAVDPKRGLLERNFAGAQTKRCLIRAARQVILVCDSSKFGASAPVVTTGWDRIDRVITDAGIPAAFTELFQDRGIPITIA